MGIRRTSWRIGWVFTSLAVDVIEGLRPRVVGLEILVRDRPRRGEAAVMFHVTEVLAPQTEQRRAVEFRVAADVVVSMRMKLAAITIAPRLFRRVSPLEVDGARAPVGLLARDVAAALKEQDALA